MESNYVIASFVAVPFFGFLLTLLSGPKKETLISRIALLSVGIQLITATLFIAYWLWSGMPVVNIKELALYETKGYEFLIDFYFDKVTAVYLFVGAFVTFLITRYSRYYMHMEDGYKRFFGTILFFYFGYNFTVLAGNFESLFIGWEILGISSFLLIAFYRERYLPVRNAVKVFSVYRIGDVGILLAMWASHHLWHENITFLKLHNYELVHEHLSGHSEVGIFISVCILVAAAAKSAQLPFSSWLPRAMEGPTPSSAIFYGSLSVHFGVFLLLRTVPFWEQQWSARVLIGLVGLATALVAFPIAQVQSTVKTQIAYASIAQIGLMFIEVALGWETLALFHFAGNAFLRTYQLLVSPSVVSYLIRDQFYHFKPSSITFANTWPRKMAASLYMLSLKEWNLDRFMNRMVFRPIKRMGHRLDFLTPRNAFALLGLVYGVGLFLLYNEELIRENIEQYLPSLFALVGLLQVFKAFSERKSPQLAWVLVIINHFWIALAVSFNEHYDRNQTFLYLSGVVVAGAVGYVCLERLKKQERSYFDLEQYYGHIYEHRKLAMVFLLSSLALMGFPITATFVGEDLIFSHIHENQFFLAFFNSLSFVLSGIALIRIYARLFLGPHVKTYHENPYRSA
jgi:NADH-quinone oxidoreductase subunit L